MLYQIPAVPGGSDFLQLSGGAWDGVPGISQGLLLPPASRKCVLHHRDRLHCLCASFSVFTEIWLQGTFYWLTTRWWRSATSAWPETSTKTQTTSAKEMWVHTSFLEEHPRASCLSGSKSKTQLKLAIKEKIKHSCCPLFSQKKVYCVTFVLIWTTLVTHVFTRGVFCINPAKSCGSDWLTGPSPSEVDVSWVHLWQGVHHPEWRLVLRHPAVGDLFFGWDIWAQAKIFVIHLSSVRFSASFSFYNCLWYFNKSQNVQLDQDNPAVIVGIGAA